MGKERDYVLLGKFVNWDFKHNILDVTLMHRNRCINFCLEKCKLGKIPICCKNMCSEELKCSPQSSSNRYLES